MPTINLQVGASTGDAHGDSITNDAGRAVGSSPTILASGIDGANDLTYNRISPGSHGNNAEASAGVRFIGVTVPNAATITLAELVITGFATYNAAPNVVRLFVSCEAADNPLAFAISGDVGGGGTLGATGAGAPNTNRPRTTASSTITVTSVVGDTEYTIDITTAVQEIVNRAGWVNGNAIVCLIDTHPDTTVNEWQDFWSYDGSTTKAAKLNITYADGSFTPIPDVDNIVPDRKVRVIASGMTAAA